MSDKKITANDIADALINLSESTGVCDKETAIGFKTSKKKDILQSNTEHSCSKFTNEIIKRQTKKDDGV